MIRRFSNIGQYAKRLLVFGLACLCAELVMGETPVSVQLDPQCQAFVEALATSKAPALETLAPKDARHVFAGLTELFGRGPESVRATDRQLANGIRVRQYWPAEQQKDLPAVVYFHGGGWLLGDLETHDALCRRLCQAGNCTVISVDYRRTPECRYPAPLDDCYNATKYVADHGCELGVDPRRIVVAGDSAGGNLALGVSIRARDERTPAILAQYLIYPVCDVNCDTVSYRQFATGYGLSREEMRWFWREYLGDRPADERASPSRLRNCAGLPTTYLLTAECDVLRDEAESLAQQLRKAGVPVTQKRYPGVIHGFVHFAGAFTAGERASSDIGQQLRDLFSQSSP